MSLGMSDATVDFLIAYLSNTTEVDWMRVSLMVAADMLRERWRAKKRKPIEKILKQRRRLGEYFTLVREMRLGNGMYFFEYFRMSVERFDRLLALVDPLIRPKRVTCNTLSSGEKLAFTLRFL
nr:uncharacterized protein LOC129383421 [Dermacentor andersoni]